MKMNITVPVYELSARGISSAQMTLVHVDKWLKGCMCGVPWDHRGGLLIPA